MGLTQEQQLIVVEIRSRIGDSALTEDELFDLYTSLQNVNAVAAEVWARKAGSAGDFIDITEGSSTRKLSQIATQAQVMAKFYADLAEGSISTTGGRPSRVRAIERP